MDVARRGERIVAVDTSLPGIYNLENLVGVIAVAASLGVDLPSIARATRRFLGVRRRQEVRGVAQGVTVIDDFAHHPTAIRETILALKGRHGPGKLIAAFEPPFGRFQPQLFHIAGRRRPDFFGEDAREIAGTHGATPG